jgi:A/G-specific adenine glycosylase
VELEALLTWYRPRRRLYPWRRARPDPYHVLVSEVMLQQTQASRVAPAFRSFIARFPTIQALASASRREVLLAWAGLGYNRRAVRLSETARLIVREHGGIVPSEPELLERLPGIGPYTAAAVAALAFGARVPAVDTNVRRVVARVVMGQDGSAASVREVGVAAAGWMDGADPAQWNQAVMDLGREVCRPVPRCDLCPLASSCAFRAVGGSAPEPRLRREGGPFEGSFRQLRGVVVRFLADRGFATVAALAEATSQPVDRVAGAIVALEADGLIDAGPAARRGSPAGRVRLRE